MKKILSAFIAAVYFSVNCALAHSTETNFWSSRRVASQQVKGETAQLEEGATVQRGNVLLAQLPMASPVDLARGKVDSAQDSVADGARTPFTIGPKAGDWLGKMVSPYGSVRDVYLSPKKDAPFIVHIQDGHGIEEAQRNISSMIEIVGQEPKIQLVGLEAAWGPFSLQPYRDYPDANITKEIADFFLKKGLIAGPEYAGLTLPTAPDFFGAEDKTLYDANVLALKTAYKTKKAALTQLGGVVNNVAALKSIHYSEQLKIFDGHFEGYHSEKEKLAVYVRYLVETHRSLKIPHPALRGPSDPGPIRPVANASHWQARPFPQEGKENRDFPSPLGRLVAERPAPGAPEALMRGQGEGSVPNLELLVRALDEEDRLNFKLVEKERRDLVEQLANKLNVQQMQDLVAKSVDYRAGRVGYGDYHSHLIEICRQHGISVGQWGHLNRYISYVTLADKIDKNSLLEEMDLLDRAIPERLARTSDEKKLVSVAYDLTLMAKLLRHEMAPTDWAAYEKRAGEIHRLGDRLSELDPTGKWESLSAKTLKPFEDFCRYATQRNNALTDNLLRRMGETQAKSAVLVAGGFHTEGLSALLRDKQVSYVVLTPKITEIPRDNKYLDLLASDPVPLEKQLAGDRIYLAKVVGMTEKSTAGLMAAIQHVVQLKKAVVGMGNSFAITTDEAYPGAKVLFELGDGRKIYLVNNYKSEKAVFARFSELVRPMLEWAGRHSFAIENVFIVVGMAAIGLAFGNTSTDMLAAVFAGSVGPYVLNRSSGKLGDLTKAEIDLIQSVVDKTGVRLFVVGSAAKGQRRGVGTDLPFALFGKGKTGTRSDIDYATVNGREELAQLASLPDVDPNFGVRGLDYINLKNSPAIEFVPNQNPIFHEQREGRLNLTAPFSLLSRDRLGRNRSLAKYTEGISSVLYVGGGFDLNNVLTTFRDAQRVVMMGRGYGSVSAESVREAMINPTPTMEDEGFVGTVVVEVTKTQRYFIAQELISLGVDPATVRDLESGNGISFILPGLLGDQPREISVEFRNNYFNRNQPIQINVGDQIFDGVYSKAIHDLAFHLEGIWASLSPKMAPNSVMVINQGQFTSTPVFPDFDLKRIHSDGDVNGEYGNFFAVYRMTRLKENGTPAATIKALMPLYHWMGRAFNPDWSRIPANEKLEQIIEVYAPVVESVLFGVVFGGTLALLGFLGFDLSTLQTVGLWGAFNGIFALSHRTFYVLENGEWKEKSLADVGKSTHLTLWAASLGVHLPLLGMMITPAAFSVPFFLSVFVSSVLSSGFHRFYNKWVARPFGLPALTGVRSDFNRARSLLFLLLKDLDDRDVFRIHSELITRYPSYKESAGELNSAASISTFWNQHLATTVGRSNDDRWTDFKNSLLSLSNPRISYIQDDPFSSGGFGEARLIKINGKDYILKTARHGQDQIPLLDAIFNIGSLLYEEKQLKSIKKLIKENKIPHVVPIHVGGGISNGRNFIVMERIKGENLNANSQISLQEALRIIDAVRWFHKNNKVHGDLKPLNIMIASEGAFLLDLGTTKQVGTKIAWDNVSTQEFSTGLDETRRGKNFNTDIYQLAATLVTAMNEDDLTRPKIFRVLERALTGIELPTQTAFPLGFDTSEFRPSAEEMYREFIRSIEDQEQPEPNPFNKQKMIGELQIAKAWNWAEMQTLNGGANNIFYFVLRLFTSEKIAKAWGMRLLPVEISVLGWAGWMASGWAQAVFGALALDPTFMGAALMAAGILVFRGIHFALDKVWARSQSAQGPPSNTFWLNTARMMPYAMLPVLVSSPVAFLVAFSVLAFDHFAFDFKQLFNKDLPLSNTATLLVISMVSATFAVVIAPIIVSNLASPMGTFFLVSLAAQAFDPVTMQSFSENPASGLFALAVGTVSNFSTYALSMGWAPMALLGFATSALLSTKIRSSVRHFSFANIFSSVSSATPATPVTTPSISVGQAVNADAMKAVIALLEGKNLGRLPETLGRLSGENYRTEEFLEGTSRSNIDSAIRILGADNVSVQVAEKYGRQVVLAEGTETQKVAVLHGILSWEQKTRDIALAVVRGMLMAGKPVLIVAEEGFDTAIINYSGQTPIEVLNIAELTSDLMDTVESRKSNRDVPLASTVLIREEDSAVLDGTKYTASTFEGISRAIQNALETLIATLRAA